MRGWLDVAKWLRAQGVALASDEVTVVHVVEFLNDSNEYARARVEAAAPSGPRTRLGGMGWERLGRLQLHTQCTACPASSPARALPRCPA